MAVLEMRCGKGAYVRSLARDIAFALNVAGHGDLAKASFPELDAATIEAVLDAAGAFATDVLAPLNRIGDQQGARHKDGKVTAAPGFAEAYRARYGRVEAMACEILSWRGGGSGPRPAAARAAITVTCLS